MATRKLKQTIRHVQCLNEKVNPVPYVLKWFLLIRPHKTIRPYEPMKMPEKEIELIIKTFKK